MAITFRYDAAAGLIGSYAAGQAAASRRRQKYLMDQLGRRQTQRFQLGRDLLRQQEARDLLQQRGAQARDLVGLRGEQAGDLLEQRGAQAGDLLEQRGMQEQGLLEQRGAQQQQLMEQAGEQRLGQERIRGEFDIDQQVVEGIRRGELELPPGTEEEMAKLDAAEQRLDKLGKDAPAARQQIQNRRRQLLRSARPPVVPELTPIERARERTILWDPDQRDYVTREQAGPKSFPVPLDADGIPDWRNAQTPDPAAEQKQRDLQQSNQFKARENLIKAQQEQAESLAGADELQPLSPEQKKALQAMVDLRQEQLDDLAGGQPAGAAPTTQAPTRANLEAAGIQPKYYYGGRTQYLPPASEGKRAREETFGQILQEYEAKQAQMASAQPQQQQAATQQAAQAPAAQQLPKVISDADYEKLSPGTEFVDAETGQKYRKPYEHKSPSMTDKHLSAFDAMLR